MLVTCGADPKAGRPLQVLDAVTVYNYYSYNYKYHTILNKNQDLITLPVKNSYTKKINFKAKKTIKKYLKNDFDASKLKYEYNGYQELTPDNKKGENIGTISIKYNGETLDTYNIKLDKTIKSNLFDKVVKCSGVVLAGFIVFLMILQFIFKVTNVKEEVNGKW